MTKLLFLIGEISNLHIRLCHSTQDQTDRSVLGQHTCAWLLALLLLPNGAVLAHDPEARAYYLGNEGVLVSSGNTKVLFDAFYDSSYVSGFSATSQAIFDGQPPYDSIAAILISHIHGDHFVAEPTLKYLRQHPQVHLFAPQQVVDALRAAADTADASLYARVLPVPLQPGDSAANLRHGNIGIEALAIPHAGGARTANVQNLAFRVTLGTSWPTVLHLGDADIDEASFASQQAFWDRRRTHLAMPPYWFLGNEIGQSILNNRIRAQQVIGIHVPSEAIGQGDAWRQRVQGDLFTDPGDFRIIAPAAH